MEHGEQEQHAMELPPGFRFHPTDEELITHYLAKKVADARFAALAVSVADLNKCEPWDLPALARMGEKEWYFFCLKDRKYPTGLRTNRATESGYWKATGKDKDILRGKALVGMKKTLVFYTGRAPKGEKSGWVMHEYRLNANTATTHKSNRLQTPSTTVIPSPTMALQQLYLCFLCMLLLHLHVLPLVGGRSLPPQMDAILASDNCYNTVKGVPSWCSGQFIRALFNGAKSFPIDESCCVLLACFAELTCGPAILSVCPPPKKFTDCPPKKAGGVV